MNYPPLDSLLPTMERRISISICQQCAELLIRLAAKILVEAFTNKEAGHSSGCNFVEKKNACDLHCICQMEFYTFILEFCVAKAQWISVDICALPFVDYSRNIQNLKLHLYP